MNEDRAALIVYHREMAAHHAAKAEALRCVPTGNCWTCAHNDRDDDCMVGGVEIQQWFASVRSHLGAMMPPRVCKPCPMFKGICK